MENSCCNALLYKNTYRLRRKNIASQNYVGMEYDRLSSDEFVILQVIQVLRVRGLKGIAAGD
jgi:hypothetical protein